MKINKEGYIIIGVTGLICVAIWLLVFFFIDTRYVTLWFMAGFVIGGCIIDAELGAGQVEAGSTVVLQQADAVNIGNDLIGRSGTGLVLTGPGSVSLVVTVAVGGVTDGSIRFNYRFVDDLYLDGRIELRSSILVEVQRIRDV